MSKHTPSRIEPMLCTLVKDVPQPGDYLFEVKWDGYRIVAYSEKRKVKLASRSGLDYTSKYPVVADAIGRLKKDVILDGEVVVFNNEGVPDFDALQLYNGQTTPIAYCVFDLLWLDGKPLKDLPLLKRKEILSKLLSGNEVLRYSESFEDGQALYQQALKLGLEGVVAKKKDSPYQEGQRNDNWLKIPARKRQEFVIGGWAESSNGRLFRSLLFGAYNGDKLEWIGRSGGGFKEKEMPAILRQLKSLEVKNSPFSNKVLDTKGAVIHFVRPELVANFEFATWTKSGRIRKPATFLGFRQDKPASEVVREVPADATARKARSAQKKSTADVTLKKGRSPQKTLPPAGDHSKTATAKKPAVRTGTKLQTAADSNWRVLERVKPGTTEILQLDNCDITLSDVEREVWPKIPKATLIQYYHEISPYILPHLEDRPLSLHIKPNGAHAPGFYIKDMEGRQPGCASIFIDQRRHPKAGKRNQIDYLVCNNEATLLYMINLGCIDVNPWMSRVKTPQSPDYINIDLDPSDDDFRKVIDTALAAKQLIGEIGLKTFVKTSGKTGIHIFIPVTGIDFGMARTYSERLGEEIRKLVPRIATTEISKGLRGNKVLIDPSQNDYADTLAAPYSVRPHTRPVVSTPLDWKEIKASLHPEMFNMEAVLKRVRKKGDLFERINDVPIRKKNAALLATYRS